MNHPLLKVLTQELTPIPLEHAIGGAEYVRNELGIDRCLVAGSIRRRKPYVKDIELVVPMPPRGPFDELGNEVRDKLLERIREKFLVPGWHGEDEVRLEAIPEAEPVFAGFYSPEPRTRKVTVPRPLPAAPIGIAVKGVKDGFRYCQLRLPGNADDAVIVSVDIFRYDPGANGNRGWIELIRTGPAEFGQRACVRWKQVGGLRSEDGYLIGGDNLPVPCATEEEAFRLLGWAWIEPWNRR